ncbi:MAG: EI24 domain-containing protein [Yoonia sp.]|nr:EI24 domain-containing protein [Yoonia sp.]
MQFVRNALTAGAISVFCTGTFADTIRTHNGDDVFITGDVVSETLATSGDAFASARTLLTTGEAAGDLHATGFDVRVATSVAEDLYAAGFTVVVQSQIAEDLTAAGYNVRTEAGGNTLGNARLFGRTITVEGPVAGALLAAGQDVFLNAPITGDVRIMAQSLTFGPDAVIAGTLTYSTSDPIAVPERVAAANRVVFERAEASDAWDEWDSIRHEMPMFPSVATMLFGFVVTLLFFVVLGAVMLGYMPKRVQTLRESIVAAPGASMLFGVVGLAMLIGLVPVTGMTIVGLPFVPIVILAIAVAWTFGYALGVYAVAMRVWTGFTGETEPTRVARLLVFTAGITLIALLNYIPFVGWVANFTLVLLGLGAIINAMFQYFVARSVAATGDDLEPTKD